MCVLQEMDSAAPKLHLLLGSLGRAQEKLPCETNVSVAFSISDIPPPATRCNDYVMSVQRQECLCR